ncbi:MAG: PilZ domain-containing protein [Treponema sp.]|nr:PilZ domain-containing protein [Treponema sp.]
MYTLAGVIAVIVILLIIGGLYTAFRTKASFIVLGLDSGFSFADTMLLWNVAQICELEQPTSLFFSLNSLSRCMNQISNQASADGLSDTAKIQNLLTKLFNFRTKLQNESDDKKGLVTTQSLDKGQKLRLILPGKGVFYSEILNNASSIVISVPKQKELIPIPADQWVGKVLSVYFWRKGDAAYVFDTKVVQHGVFMGKTSISLQHSTDLTRTQKRKAVRAKCEIYGTLFIVKKTLADVTAIETQNGYRCFIEDISESGAMIKIGGKGVQNVKIKLQFNIQNKLIVMYGVVRTVEYNENENYSHLHFECTQIDPVMRNDVLAFVYNILPENEKEILDALEQTEIDERVDASAAESPEKATAALETVVKNEAVKPAAEAPASSSVADPAPAVSSTEEQINIF